MPGIYNAKVTKIESFGDHNLYLTFEPTELFQFIPGQYISIQIDEFTYRPYSVCQVEEKLNLFAKVAHEGIGANFLKKLEVGDTFNFVGPSGRFTLREPIKEHITFITTGTGIAPCITMLNYLQKTQPNKNITLLWGLRTKEDVYFQKFFVQLSRVFKHFQVQICLSQEKAEGYAHGRIQDFLKEIPLDNQYYLCGNPNMIIEINELLLSKGVAKESIFFEEFIKVASK